MGSRYNLRNVKRAIQNPRLLFDEGVRLKNRAWGAAERRLFYRRHGNPVNVMDEDWDNLILLDACRYDSLTGQDALDGTVDRRVSVGSHSSEFIEKSFNGGEFHDTVYISANPHTDRTLDKSVFHCVIRSYNEDTLTDRELDQVHPRYVTAAALDNYSEFNDKRIILHYMQPHAPYLGPKAKALRSELAETGLEFVREAGERPPGVYKHLLEAARDGHVPEENLRECYDENVQIVLEEVGRVLEALDGKTIVTADHGELLGETVTAATVTRRFGHPSNFHAPELRFVPWLEIESQSRRDIQTNQPVEPKTIPEERVNEQLGALGYKV